jgi:predicted nicotinamide N-methyase
MPNIVENVVIGDRTLRTERPADPDQPGEFQHAPFWAEIWPAARALASEIIQETWTPGTSALEIGCGLGLPGIAALAAGLRVTFSDYEPAALQFAERNARLNGFGDFQTLLLDWCHPPQELRVPLMFGADLLYEIRNVKPLIAFIRGVLSPNGVCLLAEQERLTARALREALDESGLAVASHALRMVDGSGRRIKGTIHRLQNPGP